MAENKVVIVMVILVVCVVGFVWESKKVHPTYLVRAPCQKARTCHVGYRMDSSGRCQFVYRTPKMGWFYFGPRQICFRGEHVTTGETVNILLQNKVMDCKGLMMEAVCSSGILIHGQNPMWRNNPEDQGCSHCRENLKIYCISFCFRVPRIGLQYEAGRRWRQD